MFKNKKKGFSLLIAIAISLSSFAIPSYANEAMVSDNLTSIDLGIFQETHSLGSITGEAPLKRVVYTHTYTTSQIKAKTGYYSYTIELKFTLNSQGKFGDCEGLVTLYRNLMADQPSYSILCSISNGGLIVNSDRTKITAYFDLNYTCIPSWIVNPWTENVTYDILLNEAT